MARHNQLPLAIIELNRALLFDLQGVKSYALRGGVLSELGEYDRAIDDYTQAIALEEANAQAHYQRDMSY